MGRGTVEGLELTKHYNARYSFIMLRVRVSTMHTVYGMFFFNWKLTNFKADMCIAIALNSIIGSTQFPMHFS